MYEYELDYWDYKKKVVHLIGAEKTAEFHKAALKTAKRQTKRLLENYWQSQKDLEYVRSLYAGHFNHPTIREIYNEMKVSEL